MTGFIQDKDGNLYHTGRLFSPAPKIEADKELDIRWKAYTDFWKIVGKHSAHWQRPKTETILLLQDWIDKEVDKAVVAELQKIANTDWTEEDLETNLHNRIAQLKEGAKDESI